MDHTAYIKKLEEMLEISDFPDKDKEEIVTTLSQNIITRTNLIIASSLSEEEAAIMNELLESGKLKEAMDLLSEKHPELDELVAKTSKEVVDEFLAED